MGTKAPNLESSLSGSEGKSAPRRSSFGLLLRRTKSTELKGKKAELQRQELARQERASAVPVKIPSLPKLYDGGQLPNFGGHQDPDIRDSLAIMSNRQSGNPQQRNIPRASTDNQSRNPSKVPIPPIPSVDPYARTESMTHRGRYSYASSAVSSINSPRRVRRRKDPTPFNILIIGARSSGKTAFLNFLKTSLALPPNKKPVRSEDDPLAQNGRSGNFTSSYIESDIDNERIGLTLWDSEGLARNIVDLQLREMNSFIEGKFEETFTEEMKVVRAPGVQDTHIHCAFLLLDPARLDSKVSGERAGHANGSNGFGGKTTSSPRVYGALDEDLDIQVLRALQGKTTVIPVISKADTITTAHMKHLKKTVWDSIKKSNLDPLEQLGLEDEESDPDRLDEEDEESEEFENAPEEADSKNPDDAPVKIDSPPPPSSSKSNRISTGSIRQLKLAEKNGNGNGNLAVGSIDETPSLLPLSIISPDIYEPEIIGRKFPWGFADPMNEEHCDFMRLKEAVFTEWRSELREASRELWYENWRTTRLRLHSQGIAAGRGSGAGRR